MRFSLEEWRPEHAASLAESAADGRIVRFLRDSFPHPYTLRDAEQFICLVQFECDGYYRAIVADGKAVGGISVVRGEDVFRKSAELGYWLTPACQGNGIMTAAAAFACREVFASTDIVRIWAEPFSVNAASCRVLEKCGFTKEGIKKKSVFKGGAFYDSVIYALVKE